MCNKLKQMVVEKCKEKGIEKGLTVDKFNLTFGEKSLKNGKKTVKDLWFHGFGEKESR